MANYSLLLLYYFSALISLGSICINLLLVQDRLLLFLGGLPFSALLFYEYLKDLEWFKDVTSK